MTSKRVRHKTGTANYASTGEDLAQSLFTPEMWVDNGVMSTSRRLPASVRNMTGSMESLPAIEEASIDKTSLATIQERLDRVEKLLGDLLLLQNAPIHENSITVEDRISDEEWLSEWQAEQPEIFLSEQEVEQEIAFYEAKYQIRSEELMQKVRERKAPDTGEVMDWMMLLQCRNREE